MKKLTVMLTVVTLSCAFMVTNASAFTSFLNGVNNTCGTTYGCGVCHVDPGGGGPLNAGGNAYVNAGNNPCVFCPTAAACLPPPVCTDADSDGYFAEADCGTAVDCNDNDPATNPGATEVCNDNIDNDCDGLVDCDDPGCSGSPDCVPPPICTDSDSDGFFAEPGCGTAIDCNDANANINPAAAEVCNDSIDNDCDGIVDCADTDCTGSPDCAPPACTDADADTYFAEAGCGTAVDCDDTNAAINPGAAEVCNDSMDNDCDGFVDCDDTDCDISPDCAAPPVCTDADSDGYFVEQDCGTSIDCNDNNPDINPGVPEFCNDGIDNDCDGTVDCADNECMGTETCAPENRPEVCNDGIDNDGDRKVDCADSDCYRDPECPRSTGRRLEGIRGTCSDGADNDEDGLVDCADPDCVRNKRCKDLFMLKNDNYQGGKKKK